MEEKDISRQWARLGHHLGREVTALLDSPVQFMVIHFARPGHYIQLHGEAQHDLYSEVSSGLYNDSELEEWQQCLLAAGGWCEPRRGPAGENTLNWSRYWVSPVPLYTLIRLVIVAMRDVFGASPDDVDCVRCIGRTNMSPMDENERDRIRLTQRAM